MNVLELGCGTGNLTKRLVGTGASVWAIDFSAGMLELAQMKVPEAHYAKVALLSEYPPILLRRYHRIVSTYTFHELPIPEKLILIQRLVDQFLVPDGRLVIGDIGFWDETEREKVRKQAGNHWDEEHYWLEDETVAALKHFNLKVSWDQLSLCGTVIVIEPHFLNQ